MRIVSCEDCIFWEPPQEIDGIYGCCHKHAPFPVVGRNAVEIDMLNNSWAESEIETFWPGTSSSNYCGEGEEIKE